MTNHPNRAVFPYRVTMEGRKSVGFADPVAADEYAQWLSGNLPHRRVDVTDTRSDYTTVYRAGRVVEQAE